MERLRHDLRFALRSFAKNPGFTAMVVLTLALGIGANTAIFTLMDQVLLRLLPVAASRTGWSCWTRPGRSRAEPQPQRRP